MFQWGKNLDLFLLVAHSYRSINILPDTFQNNKTLYGKQQRFNFGHIKIEKEKDGKYHFIYNVIDSNNRIRPNSTINLIPK